MKDHFPYIASIFLLVLFVIVLTSATFAQDFKPANNVNAKDFLGKWQGTFQGKVFITVSITGDAQKLSGTVSKGNVEVNDAGELTKAEGVEGLNTIKSARVNSNYLRITTKSDDGSEDEIDSEMTLVGANQAELRLIVPLNVPPDIPRPKPWKLTRVPQP